jgi:arylsulfatase A-like enzyme/Flp pilus assembly protein TadD
VVFLKRFYKVVLKYYVVGVSRIISAFVTTGVTVLVIAAGSACGGRSETSLRDPELNVLLVTIDTLRADAVGAYGQSGATPWIDRLAGSGVRFDEARAHNVVTLPSHANILSGRLPTDHGVRDNAGFRFPAAPDTMATLLKARGYRTGAFVSAFPLESRFGLGRGFDVYDDRFADAPRPALAVQEREGTETVKIARAWIDAAGGQRWFCWVHLYEPHFPYEAPASHAQRFRDGYTAEVAAADAALAPLLAPILEARDAGRTLVVLTADHGEALGDHGEATHGVFAYEPVLRVPLVIYQPRLFEPAVVSQAASHVDLLPTVLDALAISVPKGLAGRSLLPAMAGTPHAETPSIYFEALSPSLNRRWAPLRGVYRDRIKYIELPIPELYDLEADPREANNLARAQPARVAELGRLLGAFRRSEAVPQPRAEDAQTRERLRSLGYVASAPQPHPTQYTEKDDPKHLIQTDAVLHEVAAMYFEGDVAGALAKCRELVRRRPDTPLWLLHLALLERESGNLAAGIDALRTVIALSPDDSEALSLLGAYLTEAGRAREASDLLELHARRPDAALEVLTTRALALARQGRTGDALATLAIARERDPSNAMTVVEIGTVHLMAGDRDRAGRSFQEALALNPAAARAHSSLGVLSVEDGRTSEAIAHWKAATSLDPREHEKILRVGIALARAGRTAEARACLQFFVDAAPASRYGRDIERARAWLKQAASTQRESHHRGNHREVGEIRGKAISTRSP